MICAAEFQSRFPWHIEGLDIRHVYIRPRTPHLNGKVERSHRVDAQEFYQLLDQEGIADDIHLFNQTLRVGGLLQLSSSARGHSMDNPRMNGSSQERELECHRRLRTLH